MTPADAISTFPRHPTDPSKVSRAHLDDAVRAALTADQTLNMPQLVALTGWSDFAVRCAVNRVGMTYHKGRYSPPELEFQELYLGTLDRFRAHCERRGVAFREEIVRLLTNEIEKETPCPESANTPSSFPTRGPATSPPAPPSSPPITPMAPSMSPS